MIYNSNEIYIQDTYKVICTEPYYDEYNDMYAQNIYYAFYGLTFIIKKDNKYIDILTNKEIKEISYNMKQYDIFMGSTHSICLEEYFNEEYKNIPLTRKHIKELAIDILPNLEKRLNYLKEMAYVVATPLELNGKTYKEYYNDNNNKEYYDEKKEFHKMLLYKGMKKEESEDYIDYRFLM